MRLSSDKLIAGATTAATVVWAGCITMMWAKQFDASGESLLLTLSAMLLATATVARRQRHLLAGARWILVKLGRPLGQTLSAIEPPDALPTAQMRMHLLGAAASVALAGSAISMLLVLLASWPINWAADQLGWTLLSWGAFKLVIQWVALLPLGAAMTALLATANMSTADDDASTDTAVGFLLSASAGLAVFAGVWWSGILHLLILAGVMAGALLLLAWLCFGIEPFDAPQPARLSRREAPRQGAAVRLFLTTAGLALIVAMQMRLIGDLVGFGTTVRTLWAAATLAMLAAMMQRTGSEDMAALLAAPAALIGVVFVVGIQIALTQLCVADTPAGIAGVVLAVGAQLPLVTLGAMLLAEHARRVSRSEGGLGRAAAVATAGAGCGLLLHLLGGMAVLNWLQWGLGLSAAAGAVVIGTARLKQISFRVTYVAGSAALLAAMIASIWASGSQLGGQTMTGMALTFRGQHGTDENLLRLEGSLPTARAWRSKGVTEAMHEVLTNPRGKRSYRGRWWVIASSFRDWPEVPGVYVAASVPDASALSRRQTSGLLLLGIEGAYQSAAQIGRGKFDGVLLAPLAADHPNAWRCYNLQTIRYCYERTLWRDADGQVAGGGVMMLRTQVARTNLPDAFAAVRTFLDVVGSGWAVVELDEGLVDFLVVGPTMRNDQTVVPRPSDRPGVMVVNAKGFCPEETAVRPLDVLQPHGPRKPHRASLWKWYLYRKSQQPKQPGGEGLMSND
ncbi:MAG: hypothetical protein ACYS8X_12645 [Planctomycetota bacterium]|jgi:hypothetical protein